MTKEELKIYIAEEIDRLSRVLHSTIYATGLEFQKELKLKVNALGRKVEEYLAHEKVVNKNNFMGIDSAMSEGLRLSEYKQEERERKKKKNLLPKLDDMLDIVYYRTNTTLALVAKVCTDDFKEEEIEALTNAITTPPYQNEEGYELNYEDNFDKFIYYLQKEYPSITAKQIAEVTNIASRIRKEMEISGNTTRMEIEDFIQKRLLNLVREYVEISRSVSNDPQPGSSSSFK